MGEANHRSTQGGKLPDIRMALRPRASDIPSSPQCPSGLTQECIVPNIGGTITSTICFSSVYQHRLGGVIHPCITERRFRYDGGHS